MKYHPHLSPRSLVTVENPLVGYPKYWELLKWYTCWRKVPYESDAIAFLVADGRSEEYRHYPCPIHPEHWHVGRGRNQADPRKRIQRAKRTYRKAVRDEIWREHVVRQQAEERAVDADTAALAD